MTSHHASMLATSHAPAGQLDVVSPWDRSIIATIDTDGPAAVDAALAAAHAAFRDRKGWLPVPRRIEILQRTAALMEKQVEELALEAAREGGKPLIDSRAEVVRAIDSVRIAVECLRTNAGEVIPMDRNAASARKYAFTIDEPIGVVVAVSAFNHPLNLIVHQVAPAIAAGCPVIVKPAEATPLSCFRFVSLLREAGLPAVWCQALVTDTLDTASALVTDDRVGFFTFIGSAKVGWMLRSRLAPGTRCALEHGGAAPVIVAADADLDHLIPRLLKGGFYHAGQVCVSVQRVFAHQSVARQLAERLAKGAAELVVGDPTDAATEVGPLIRPAEVERVGSWVDKAVAEGAELLTGGHATSATTYACTVLWNPAVGSQVSTAEIFGPVVCVYPYDDVDEAIARANALPWSFQASVFTNDRTMATHAARALDASAVFVNEHTAFRVDWMPFAGLRQSGLGTGGIPYTLRDMTTRKMVVVPTEG